MKSSPKSGAGSRPQSLLRNVLMLFVCAALLEIGLTLLFGDKHHSTTSVVIGTVLLVASVILSVRWALRMLRSTR